MVAVGPNYWSFESGFRPAREHSDKTWVGETAGAGPGAVVESCVERGTREPTKMEGRKSKGQKLKAEHEWRVAMGVSERSQRILDSSLSRFSQSFGDNSDFQISRSIVQNCSVKKPDYLRCSDVYNLSFHWFVLMPITLAFLMRNYRGLW